MEQMKKRIAAAAASVMMTAACAAFPVSAGTYKPEISMGLTAGGTAIGVNVYIQLQEGDAITNYTVTFDGAAQTGLELTDKGYVISVPEYAMNMTKKHTLTVKSKTGSYDKTVTCSVRDYLNEIKDTEGYEALAKSILMYGGAAQTYFGVNEDDLASAGITGADYSNALPDAAAFDKDSFNQTLAAKQAPVSYYGMNLSLQSETAFTLFFSAAEGQTLADAEEYLSGLTFGGSTVTPGKNGKSFLTVSAKVPASKISDTLALGSLASFSPAQYIAAAAATNDTKLANVCKALYAYSEAVQNFKEPQTSGKTLADDEALHSGIATAYDYKNRTQQPATHLDDYIDQHTGYIAALTDNDYAAYAGGMIEVTYQGNTIKAIVGDLMPKATNQSKDDGDIDLEEDAFKALTGEDPTALSVSWKLIPNAYAVGSKIQYHIEHGSNTYYIKIQPRNTVYPVTKVEYLQADGTYAEAAPTDSLCYLIKGLGTPVISLRITDIYGQVVEENDFNTKLTGTDLGSDVCYDGTVQFGK